MSPNTENTQPVEPSAGATTRESMQAERTLRIDITGNSALVGKTTVAAIIAKALKEAFEPAVVQVYSGEGDFHYRSDAQHEPPKTNADRIVVVDNNAPMAPLADTPAGRVYEMVGTPTGPYCTSRLSKDAPHTPIASIYGSQTGGMPSLS